ncbi:MAG: hypothetical protein ABR548_08185 [Actinomycetota bacterium]|nr:hypothetical protein [Actinomycetota bacterium]
MRKVLRAVVAAAIVGAALFSLQIAHADAGVGFSTPNNAFVLAVPADVSETGIASSINGTADGVTAVTVTLTDLTAKVTSISATLNGDGTWTAPLDLMVPGAYTANATGTTGSGSVSADPITVNII